MRFVYFIWFVLYSLFYMYIGWMNTIWWNGTNCRWLEFRHTFHREQYFRVVFYKLLPPGALSSIQWFGFCLWSLYIRERTIWLCFDGISLNECVSSLLFSIIDVLFMKWKFKALQCHRTSFSVSNCIAYADELLFVNWLRFQCDMRQMRRLLLEWFIGDIFSAYSV